MKFGFFEEIGVEVIFFEGDGGVNHGLFALRMLSGGLSEPQETFACFLWVFGDVGCEEVEESAQVVPVLFF